MEAGGIEPCSRLLRNHARHNPSGAESGALDSLTYPLDEDLASIVAAWPALPDAVRTRIVAKVNSITRVVLQFAACHPAGSNPITIGENVSEFDRSGQSLFLESFSGETAIDLSRRGLLFAMPARLPCATSSRKAAAQTFNNMRTLGNVWRVGSRSEPRPHESGSVEMEKLRDYLRISEAAECLGVSPNTLRNWVNAGKIAAVRHPVNDYRLFKREDLDALLKQVAVARKRAAK